MIELSNINKAFGDREIFKDFSMRVEKGEFICITGPSGAGKSTLINMMGGLETHDSGNLSINGISNPNEKERKKILVQDLGFVFQNYMLMDKKSVQDNLLIVKNNDNKITRVNMINALIAVGLDESYLKQKVNCLSGGEQQRVSIARILLKNSAIILADEPTGNLDKSNSILIKEIFIKQKSLGKTIICVTHDDILTESADRLVTLEKY